MDQTVYVNSVFQGIGNSPPFAQPCRVLWINNETDEVVFISIGTQPKQPWIYNLSLFTEAMNERKVMQVNLKIPDFMMILEEEIPVTRKAMRDTNWERIRPLVEDSHDGDIFLPRRMGRLIQAHAKFIGVTRKTLYRLLYRYWMFGSIRNALLPQYSNSHAIGVAKKYLGGKRPGRPPRVLSTEAQVWAKSLTDQDKAIIRVGYALYKDNEVKTISDAYTRTLRHYYCDAIATPGFPEVEPVLKPLGELPTARQFEYWGKKAFDDVTVLRSRKGERKWAKDHRHLRGYASQGLFGPCHRFEIDATIADIYLVSRFNRSWIIGRPVVYVVVDVFSRMIVGIYVGLEGPSWNGARQALLNAFNDKVAFCTEYGIHIKPGDWPCFHLPQELCADRGEMLGQAAEGIVSGLGIDLVITPPYRPDWKAVVESRFRILNQLTQVHFTPGGVAERIKERGNRDYRLDATLDLKQFSKIIIASVLHYNQHREQPHLLNNHMITEGIASTPLSLWNWGIDHGFGKPKIQAESLVKLHLMAKSSGTVQAGGIFFSGMFYVAEDGKDDARYSRARAKGREHIDVWHDCTDSQYIWIRASDMSLKRCILRESDVRYKDHRIEEILDMFQMVKNVSADRRHEILESKVALDQYIQATISIAIAEKAAAEKTVSKTAQLADIRQNRAFEQQVDRIQLSPVVTRSDTALPPNHLDQSSSEIFGGRGGEIVDILSNLKKKPKA